ncbi:MULTISPECIES: hypothetical protein [Actinomadura]|uniref:CDP-Glycerol:Poly(Glycerophosphate) glycerophosphotransferase n=1 Tax=Actinomadura madurae TaxID=1993 RepID=A0A1I5NC26_9ACTN|nr:hypothetical protein [Actinomadura madurae]SFP19329.1 hypothetical protein SAMN04489713_11295 [Actinomadura madurae]SPT50213.1 Uncharacterised protein [Actinomadura madurae]
MEFPANAWVPGPFGLDALRGSTVRAGRTVLAVAHHVTAATRLADVMPLLETDRRVAVAYTASPASAFTGGLDAHLRDLGGLVVPWQQAVATRWDLVVAASHGMLEKLHGPVMTVLHGAGPGKLLPRLRGAGPPAARPVSGLIRERLVVAGRVVPSSIVLAHDRHREMLERECPEAGPVAFTAGDPCLDRLLASMPYRSVYRRALGVRPGRRLVFVSSTWNGDSLLGRHPDLLLRVAAELPRDRYQIVAALHPNVWSYHSKRQVLAWHADCLRLGVRLFPPEEGWRAGLVAADVLIGDHGSVTCYGAAIGVPVLLGTFPEDAVAPGTHVAGLGALAPRVDWDRPLVPQLEEAAHAFTGRVHAAIRNAVSSRPGEAAGLIRGEMYRLLRLPDRECPPDVQPVPLPVDGLPRAA